MSVRDVDVVAIWLTDPYRGVQRPISFYTEKPRGCYSSDGNTARIHRTDLQKTCRSKTHQNEESIQPAPPFTAAEVRVSRTVLTVQSLNGGAVDLSIPTDQEVQSRSGGVQVPETDHLIPAVLDVWPLVRQGHANNPDSENRIDDITLFPKSTSQKQTTTHPCTTSNGIIVLPWPPTSPKQSPPCASAEWINLLLTFEKHGCLAHSPPPPIYLSANWHLNRDFQGLMVCLK
ncbi:hypothetical protein INR49_002754 [Caranx melampygus]|nr:hypothetical protein INR49_002754 [Caranx melampygus]